MHGHVLAGLGPGKVLCGLVKSISKEVKLLNVENPASLQDTLTKLRAATE